MVTIGIDLGTSNSVVAIYRRGRAETLRVEGRTVTPSCVAVSPKGGLLVGQQAKQRARIDPQQTVQAIKRHMGDRDYRVELAGQSFTPVEISALILKKLVEAAADQLGEPVADAVISVPAYFTNNQKEDTLLAGKKAGINVLRLIPEPTAAAVAYGMNQGRDQTILVFDLGGGTFDVSVLRVRKNRFDVLGVGGDHNLGGEDFDQRMIALITNRLRRDKNIASEMAAVDPHHLEQQIKEAAEAAKKELSFADNTEVQIPNFLNRKDFYLKLSREQYDDAIADLVEKTIRVTMGTLKVVGISPEDVDRVVMVGGSTRIPLVQKKLSYQICEPYIADNVDEVVAQGAAIMAENLRGAIEREPDLVPIEVSNITAHSLGLRVDNDRFSVIIPRGTKLPAEASKIFTTARDHADKTDIIVVQGEHELCSNNQQIGGFSITGIQRNKAGEPKIDVKFSLDADDILKVDATDRATGQCGKIIIKRFEPQPFNQSSTKDIGSLRIGVSAKGCDDAGSVITQMGFPYRHLKHSQFQKMEVLSQLDLVFINCLADVTQVSSDGIRLNPTKSAETLRRFVDGGGVLYVSDYALANISIPFPGYIQFGKKGDGKSGNVIAEVVDGSLRKLIGATVPINFNTCYAPVNKVSSDCAIHLAKGDEPILVSFAYGKGYVVYTSFHNGVQVSEQENTLLEFIILRTMSFATNTPLVEIVDSNKLKRW